MVDQLSPWTHFTKCPDCNGAEKPIRLLLRYRPFDKFIESEGCILKSFLLTEKHILQKLPGEMFSLTPLWVRPKGGGANHNDKAVMISPLGHTEAIL